MRVALVHDWLVAQRGGEQVLLEMAKLFPKAPIYTLVCDPKKIDPYFHGREIHTSFIQNLWGSPGKFRRYLPLFPRAIEEFELENFDLVLSTSHCVAKGIRTPHRTQHLSYIHSPMRYAWDQTRSYLPAGFIGELLLPMAKWATSGLRRWDENTARRPTHLLCNSAYVAGRIRKFWHEEASVLHPPIDVDFFAQHEKPPRNDYLVVTSLVPYKGVDVVIEMANQTRKKVTIVGEGPLRHDYEKRAGPTVQLVGHLDREALRHAYASHQALIHAAVEDFGMVPLEAAAAGCPTIALGYGGNLETVRPGINGLHFAESTAPSLAHAVEKFENDQEAFVAPKKEILAHAQQFHRNRFISALRKHIDDLMEGKAL